MHPVLQTPVCDLLGCRVPIVQTGMGWVAGAELVAATTEAGGFGFLASATMSLSELDDAIATVRQRTDGSFGVNVRADVADIDDRLRLVADSGVRVVGFAQAPKAALIDRLHAAGITVVATVGARRHAEKVIDWGVDALIAQGGEGGGHTGSVPTSLLLPQVVDAVDGRVPVIAAGGFFDGRGLVAALAYGASGIAMGTRFLLTQESTVPLAVKQHYLARTVNDTIVSAEVDGVPHRVLRSPLVERLHRRRALALPRAVANAVRFKRMSDARWRDLVREGLAMRASMDLSWSQTVMAANTPMLLRASLVEGRVDSGVMASGQVVGLIDDLPSCADVLTGIVDEAERVLARLGARTVERPGG